MVTTRWAMAVLATVLLAGCSADEAGPATAQPPARSSSPATGSETTPTTPAATSTRELDSIAVLGHSGATGTRSDPDYPLRDAHENSWATGANPRVQSIYRRLLANHPSMKGHNYNHAVNGATINDLEFQFENLLTEADPLPDLILIQMIDNDIKCDGGDPDNYQPFAATLDQALTRMEHRIPGVQLYLVSPWATVPVWTRWASHHEEQVAANSGTGPCDVFDATGQPRPAGMRSLESIVDAYWRQVEKVCGRHEGCNTDGGALTASFVPTDRDLSDDLNHLSIAGHHKYAELAWRALPEAIKERK